MLPLYPLKALTCCSSDPRPWPQKPPRFKEESRPQTETLRFELGLLCHRETGASAFSYAECGLWPRARDSGELACLFPSLPRCFCSSHKPPPCPPLHPEAGQAQPGPPPPSLLLESHPHPSLMSCFPFPRIPGGRPASTSLRAAEGEGVSEASGLCSSVHRRRQLPVRLPQPCALLGPPRDLKALH